MSQVDELNVELADRGVELRVDAGEFVRENGLQHADLIERVRQAEFGASFDAIFADLEGEN